MKVNEVIIRFKDQGTKESLELLLDQRLSFRENFELLKKIGPDLSAYCVYDPEKKVFLNMAVPLSTFAVYDHLYLCLFRMC